MINKAIKAIKAILYPQPKTKAEVFGNCNVWVYVSGTNDLAMLYQDEDLCVPMLNPVMTDGEGVLPYLWTPTPYRVEVINTKDELIYVRDDHE